MKIPKINYIEPFEIPTLIDKPSGDWSKTLEEIELRKDVLDLMCKSALAFHNDGTPNSNDFMEGYIRGACLTYSLIKSVVKPIPPITMDNLSSALASLQHDPVGKNKEAYKRMYEEQPLFLEMTAYVVDNDMESCHFKDGFCKAMAQFYDLIWRALEAKELEEMFA